MASLLCRWTGIEVDSSQSCTCFAVSGLVRSWCCGWLSGLVTVVFCGVFQWRLMVSLRKWVAHEMHGSWLRIACSQRCWRASSGRVMLWVTIVLRSSSIERRFWDVGGMMRASVMMPLSSVVYLNL